MPAWAQAQPAPAPSAAPAASAASKEDEEKKKKEEAIKALDRIVVTATGRAQAASSVPYNVTAQSEEALREENITDVKKLIQASPSINAPQNSARFADSVTVRGLNVSPVNANNLEQFTRSTLAYYLDDTPLPNIGYRIKDISRVETLLGPQGTLYGAGSLGGTVRYITNQPDTKRLGVRATSSLYQVQGGKFSHDTDGVVNIPLGEQFALRASFAKLDDGGYTDRVSNPSWRTGALAWTTFPNPNQNVYKNDDFTKTDTARIALAWQATKGIRLTLAHATQDQLANGTSATSLLPLGVANANSPADVTSYVRDPDFSPCTTNCNYPDRFSTPELAGKDVIASRYPEFAKRKFNLSSFTLEWDLGFAALRSSTSQFKDSRRGQADYAGQGYVFYYSFGDAGGKFDSGRSAFITFDNTYSGTNHETRLTSKGDGALNWIAGVYHTKNKRNLRFSEFLPGLDAYNGVNRATAGGNVDEGYRENLGSEYKETALYGEFGYKVTPQWLLTAGARVFSYDDTAVAQIRDYSFDLVNNNVNVTRGDDGKSYFKLNTSYQINNDALAYFTASQGFRRGGTNGFRNVGTRVVSPDVQQYQPDSTMNYEIGLKGSFFNRQLYVQAGIYQIDWKDVQTYFSQTISGFPVNGTANGADARSQGFELGLLYRVNDNLTLRLQSAYTDARWSSTKTTCLYTNNTGCTTWSKGGLLGGAPAWKHNFGARYSHAFESGNTGWVSLAGRWRDKVQSRRADTTGEVVRLYPAFTIFDLRAGTSWDNLDLSVWVENVANKRVLVSEQRDDVMGTRAIYTTPRTIGVTLSYTY
jgi:iron complex outermembrane recepter protein